jgi:hypothetical protein
VECGYELLRQFPEQQASLAKLLARDMLMYVMLNECKTSSTAMLKPELKETLAGDQQELTSLTGLKGGLVEFRACIEGLTRSEQFLLAGQLRAIERGEEQIT